MTDDPLDRVRRICLSLPEAVETEAWGAPTWRLKKMFAMYAAAAAHGQGEEAVWCNAPLGVQEAVVRSDPRKYFVPPYVGVKGWIGIRLHEVSDEDLRADVLQSYCMIAPRKLQALVLQ